MKKCPLCYTEAKYRFGLGHTAAWACVSPVCGLLFADPQLDEKSLKHAYTAHYYPSNGNGNGNGNGKSTSYENTPEEILRQTFNRAESELGPLVGKNLLDFGCGVGGLCKIASEYGIRVSGIEPDANAREKALKSSDLRVNASLDGLRQTQPEAKFDIVTMWDVIEHLREPWKVLEELSTVLQPDGWLLLSTPNAASLRARLQRDRWENMVNPTHFYYFTRKSLESALVKGGFFEFTELRFPIRYPGHGWARQLLHQALVSCQMQGQLVFLARQSKFESANGLRHVEENHVAGVHAGG